MALHYRHLGTQIARHMREKPLDDILLDRVFLVMIVADADVVVADAVSLLLLLLLRILLLVVILM